MQRLGDAAVGDVLARLRAAYDADPERQAREAERAAPRVVRPWAPTADTLLAAQVPRRNWPWILGDAPQTDTFALRTLRALGGHAALVMCGSKDSGRTGAGSWWVAQQEGSLFVHAERLIERWLGNQSALYACPRLFIDDLGQEPGSNKQHEIVLEAVDCLFKVRSADLLPTVAATNFSPADFAEYLGDRWQRMRDRLVEFGPTGEKPGFVACPVEGLRCPERRRKILEARRP